MNASHFNRAIVRRPSRSCIHGLRARDTGAPNYEVFRVQHEQYTAALRNQGLEITKLPSLEAFPDSVFVEDIALCLRQGVVMLRPGAPSRAGEVAASLDELADACEGPVHLLQEGHVDGGDIMLTDQEVIIGLSGRTNELGVRALEQIIAPWGYRIRREPTPEGVLHFKSDSSYLGDKTILCTPRLAATRAFDTYDVIETPPAEDGAANALRINDVVLIPTGYPETHRRLSNRGFSVETVDISEAAKLDGGLSCMSLRSQL
jgi:dimethylargininase